MTSLADKAKKLVIGSRVPRLAYRHLFVEDETTRSMIHVQNPFSFIDPEGAHEGRVEIEGFDKDGRSIGVTSKVLGTFASLALPVRELDFDFTGVEHGTVTVDIEPSKSFEAHVRRIAPGIPRIGSPFWMRFYDQLGSQAFVHSIEADRTRFRGLTWPLSKIGLSARDDEPWSSHRSIELAASDSAIAFVINHSGKTFTTNCQWRAQTGDVIAEEQMEIPAGGVRVFPTPKQHCGTVHLHLSRLSTPNAKPYVMTRTQSRLFGLTHG